MRMQDFGPFGSPVESAITESDTYYFVNIFTLSGLNCLFLPVFMCTSDPWTCRTSESPGGFMKTQSGAHSQSSRLGRGSVCTVSDRPPSLSPSLSSPHWGTRRHHSSIYYCLNHCGVRSCFRSCSCSSDLVPLLSYVRQQAEFLKPKGRKRKESEVPKSFYLFW